MASEAPRQRLSTTQGAAAPGNCRTEPAAVTGCERRRGIGPSGDGRERGQGPGPRVSPRLVWLSRIRKDPLPLPGRSSSSSAFCRLMPSYSHLQGSGAGTASPCAPGPEGTARRAAARVLGTPPEPQRCSVSQGQERGSGWGLGSALWPGSLQWGHVLQCPPWDRPLPVPDPGHAAAGDVAFLTGHLRCHQPPVPIPAEKGLSHPEGLRLQGGDPSTVPPPGPGAWLGALTGVRDLLGEDAEPLPHPQDGPRARGEVAESQGLDATGGCGDGDGAQSSANGTRPPQGWEERGTWGCRSCRHSPACAGSGGSVVSGAAAVMLSGCSRLGPLPIPRLNPRPSAAAGWGGKGGPGWTPVVPCIDAHGLQAPTLCPRAGLWAGLSLVGSC